MGLFRFSVLALIVATTANACSADVQPEPDVRRETEKLKETLASLSIGKDAYWLEMLNLLGEWEPVIAVFGYGDDLSACETIRDHAIETAPDRDFRCSVVR